MYIKAIAYDGDVLQITDKYDSIEECIEELVVHAVQKLQLGVPKVIKGKDWYTLQCGSGLYMQLYETTKEEWVEWNLLK